MLTSCHTLKHLMNKNHTFLNGDLFEEMCMDISLGYGKQVEIPDQSGSRMVC